MEKRKLDDDTRRFERPQSPYQSSSHDKRQPFPSSRSNSLNRNRSRSPPASSKPRNPEALSGSVPIARESGRPHRRRSPVAKREDRDYSSRRSRSRSPRRRSRSPHYYDGYPSYYYPREGSGRYSDYDRRYHRYEEYYPGYYEDYSYYYDDRDHRGGDHVARHRRPIPPAPEMTIPPPPRPAPLLGHNQIRAPMPNPVKDQNNKVFLNRHYIPGGGEDHTSTAEGKYPE